jgi:cytidine deaminase
MTNDELLKISESAQNNAYAPYSNFKVGAALLTSNGQVFTGSNVENSSYGLSMCAERIAVFKAVNAGETKFKAIALCGLQASDYVYPCGACLQVLAEFSPDMKVIVKSKNQAIKEFFLKEMLPQIFSLDGIGG